MGAAASPRPHPLTQPPRQSFKVYQELQFEKESAVGCFRRKGAADQDEFSRLGSIDWGVGGGERTLSERVFSKRALGPQVPFHKSTFLSKVPISERGGDPLLAGCGGVCGRARARRAPGRGRVEDEDCGLHSARAGDANISRIINVLVGRDQT